MPLEHTRVEGKERIDDMNPTSEFLQVQKEPNTMMEHHP